MNHPIYSSKDFFNVIAPAAGNYQLVLRGRSAATTGAGKYKLEVKALRAATEQDRQYTAAHRLTQEGVALVRRQGLAKFREAFRSGAPAESCGRNSERCG